MIFLILFVMFIPRLFLVRLTYNNNTTVHVILTLNYSCNVYPNFTVLAMFNLSFMATSPNVFESQTRYVSDAGHSGYLGLLLNI
jgi:hypothetical protein